MTEDVSAGRLHMDVVADPRGIARGLQAKVNAEMARANVRAKIKAEIDTKGIAAEAKRAAAVASKAAQSNVRIKIKAEIDTKGLAGQASQAARDASKSAVMTMKAVIDPASVAKAKADVAAASGGVKATVNVDADTAAASAEVEALRAAAGRPVNVNVNVNTSSLKKASTAIGELSKLPAMAGGFYILGTSIVQVGGGLVALASSATSAAGALAAIPNLAGAGITALATLITGFSGVGEAVKQMQAVEGAAATTATTAAAAREGAARRVADAQRALGDAVRNAGVAAKAAAESVSDAQWALGRAGEAVADAQRAVGDAVKQTARDAAAAAEAVRDAAWSYRRSGEAVVSAQEGLDEARYHSAEATEAAAVRIRRAETAIVTARQNTVRAETNLGKARAAATERIEDMNRALKESVQDEEGASDALIRARENLADVEWNAAASPQERRDAEIAVRDAERQLERLRSKNLELAEDVAAVNASGVEGSDEVVDAQAAIVQANDDQIAAVAELKDARTDAAHQAEEIARQIRDAEYAVRDAIHAQGEAREELRAARQAEARQVETSARAQADAERGLRDAIHAQGEAREELILAQEAQKASAVASARAIADAQRAVRDAQKGVADVAAEQTAAQVALASAMDNLSPAGQRFATFLNDVMLPRLHEFKLAIQEALLPGIQEGLTRAMPLLDTLQTGMTQTARILGQFATKLGTLFGSDSFNFDISKIMKSNNRVLRDFLAAAKNLIEIFVDIAVVAGPALAEPFAEWVRQLTRGWKQAAEVNRETDAMKGFFERAGKRAATLKDILGNLWTALLNVGGAATPTGDSLLKAFEKTTQKWANWTESDLGKKRMEEFFEAVEPTTRAVGDLVAQLTEMLIKLGEGSGSPVTAFVKTLTTIVNSINKLLDVPGVGPAIGWLFTLAGVGGALGLVASGILGMVANISRLAALSGITAMFTAFRNSLLLTRIQLMLLATWTGIVAGAQAAWTGIVWAFNAAWAANPIGLIVLGIGILIGLLVLAYNKFDWFKNGVDAVMGRVVDAFNWVVDGAAHLWDVLFGHSVFPDIMAGLSGFKDFVDKIFDAVKFAFRAVGAAFQWVWENAIQPAWESVKSGIKSGWENVVKPVLTAVWKGVEVVGGWFSDLWTKYIKPAWDNVKTAIDNGWENVIKPVLTAVWKGVEVVGGWFKSLWTDYIKPAWDNVKTALDNGWVNVIKPVLTAVWKGVEEVAGWFRSLWKDYIDPAWDSIKSAIDKGWTDKIKPALQALKEFVDTTIPTAFATALTAVKDFWDDVKAKAKVPIKFVLDTVWNNGLRKMIGYIPGVGMPGEIDVSSFASGTARVLPGYTPGRDVHHFTSPTGGRLNLSGGEAIMRPEFTDRLGEGTINVLNRAAASGKGALEHAVGALAGNLRKPGESHFATGGVFRSAVNRSLDFFLGGVLPLEGGAATNIHDLPYYSTGAGWAGDLNSPGDLNNPPSRIFAWQPGTVGHVFNGYGDSHGRYGNHVVVNNDAGGSAWYAHLSSILPGLLGKHVGAGDTLGRVGATGNVKPAGAAHLHFEVRGAPISGGIGPVQQTYVDPAIAEGEKKADGWRERIGNIKDLLASVPGWIAKLRSGEMGPWADNVLTGVRSMGADVIKWLNDKIPDEIKMPGKLPDIPLPKNPIGNLFDEGGEWRHGVLGVNLSGKSETVFTNTDMVQLGASLRNTAATLRSLIGDAPGGGAGGGLAPLVGELTLMGRPTDFPNMLGDVDIALRKIRRGGVHAERVAGAPA